MKSIKYKNDNIGAKVAIPKLLKSITPEKGWFYLKNVIGVIVPKDNYEQYYHTSTGGSTYPTKHLIKNDCYTNYAIKLDDNIVDIEGNNIVVIREWDLKFLEELFIEKPISKKEYNKALKVVEEYENYRNLKNIGKL